MKTVIKIKTLMCPTGIGNVNAICREHINADFAPVNPICSKCGIPLKLATFPDDKMTMTVIGEEDIETEIEEAKKGNRKDIDVSDPSKENAYRNKRKADIAEAIAKARLLEDV